MEVRISIIYNDADNQAYRIIKDNYGFFDCERFTGLTPNPFHHDWENIGSYREFEEAVGQIRVDARTYGQIHDFDVEGSEEDLEDKEEPDISTKIKVTYSDDGIDAQAYKIVKDGYGSFNCERFTGLTPDPFHNDWEIIGSSNDYQEAINQIREDAETYGEIEDFEIED